MIAFTGCSFTAGYGWGESLDSKEDKDSPYLWTNICCKTVDQFYGLPSVNLSQSGASNTDIFEQAVQAISIHKDQLQYLICQWTSFPRYRLTPSLDKWITDVSINPNVVRRVQADINLGSGESWSKEYVNDLIDRFLVLHHLHPEILKIVRYTNIIADLCKAWNIVPVFVNGLCGWDNNYFVNLQGPNVCPEDYTNFTKKNVLDIDSKTDEEIFRLYKLIHQDYEHAGGIDPCIWVNLYESWIRLQADYNSDSHHPGIKSNMNQANQIKKYIEQLK